MIFSKRIIKLLSIVVLSLFFVSACSFQSTNPEELTPEEDLMGIKLNISSTVDNFIENEAFDKNFFKNWCSENNIKLLLNQDNKVVLESKSTNNEGSDSPTVLLNCEFNKKQTLDEQKTAFSTVLYLLSHNEDNSNIKALFTCNFDDRFSAIQSIDDEYLSSDYVINIIGSEKTYFYTNNASCNDYVFTKELHSVKPSCGNAYELSIKNLRGANSGDTTLHPNPIKIIGDFLAFAKSQGCIIELISFEGGEISCNYPTNATAKFLINDNDITKFERWYENSYDRFESQYESVEPDFEYNFTEIEKPEMVISQDDSTGIFTFIYTMINGVYSKAEGNIDATSSISTISTENQELRVETCLRSLTPEVLEDMKVAFTTISGLNDISFKNVHQTNSWSIDENASIIKTFEKLFNDIGSKKIKKKASMYTTSLNFITKNHPESEIISISVNFDKGIKEVLVIQNFIVSLSNNSENTNNTESE